MQLLKERILQDGICFKGGILKVDSFLNHQIDPLLMYNIAKEFVERFKNEKVSKILTIESSGIAPAILVGYLMNLPVVFIKKKEPKTMSNSYVSKVYSFTKEREYTVSVSGDFLNSNDKFIFIDDFLAYGNAALGVIDLAKQSGAQIAGMGFVIEKAFQHGRDLLVKNGIRIESLAIIEDLSNCQIKIK